MADLLMAKLHVPPARPLLVPRPRLLARLNAGLAGKLTVVAALDSVAPGVGSTPLALLRSPQPSPIEAVLTTLSNALAAHATADGAAARRYILVLDDYHLVDAPAVHQAPALLLDHLPPQLHLVIATRVEPPSPLARLRARGELAERQSRRMNSRFSIDDHCRGSTGQAAP